MRPRPRPPSGPPTISRRRRVTRLRRAPCRRRRPTPPLPAYVAGMMRPPLVYLCGGSFLRLGHSPVGAGRFSRVAPAAFATSSRRPSPSPLPRPPERPVPAGMPALADDHCPDRCRRCRTARFSLCGSSLSGRTLTRSRSVCSGPWCCGRAGRSAVASLSCFVGVKVLALHPPLVVSVAIQHPAVPGRSQSPRLAAAGAAAGLPQCCTFRPRTKLVDGQKMFNAARAFLATTCLRGLRFRSSCAILPSPRRG